MSSAAEAGYDSSPAVTQTIGKAAEVPPGTKKIFIVKDKPILVINDNGTLYATSGLCSFRDSLENGIYSNGRIRCSLHGACYNVVTGNIEEYPALDNLWVYDVKDNDGDLVINTTEMQLANLRRVRRSHVTELDKTAPIVVVGAGMSAATFVEQARLTGCTTPITMITQEDFLPYDRAQLSKIPATPGKEIELRDGDYYKENQINILTNAHVNYIDVNRHSLALSTGKRLRFSKLVLALGAEPKKLDIPGADLKNIFTVRVPSDANNIAALSVGKKVVCVGGSFVAMEMASTLAESASKVTVICDTNEPMPILGADIGITIRKYFEKNGVKVLVNATPAWFVGSGQVTGVQVESGEIVNADLVVLGVGTQPPTDFLKGTNVKLDEDGYILVDSNFKTSAEDVYAIGDAVKFPLPQWNIDSVNIAHFQAAQSHGQMLAYSIEGNPYPHELVPFFMTKFFLEYTIQFAGCPKDADEEIVHGNLSELNFAKYYLKGDVVVAVASSGDIPTAVQFLELFRRKIKITREDLNRNKTRDWMAWLNPKDQ